MIPIKTAAEAEIMRRGGKILAEILNRLKEAALPGVPKTELDKLARRLCEERKVKPSFLGYGGYPAAVCVSVNNEVVHGLPNETELKEGDLVSLDMGVKYEGFHTDSALSFVCGEIKDEEKERLIKTGEQCFYTGIDQIKNGVHLGDISSKIQVVAEKQRYGVIRMLVGHGIGREVHEEPHVPNYGEAGTGPILKTGMTLAIEPMLTASGNYEVILSEDGWTYITLDDSLATHFEHTVLVTDESCEVLTQI